MFKLKKLLAGVLGAAMVLSSMSMTAFAAGDETTPTTTATIDTAQRGSVTIYKYEMETAPGNLPTGSGTGMTGQSIPDGAKLLNDVEFTIWKVAGIFDEDIPADGSNNAAVLTWAKGKVTGDGTVKTTGKDAAMGNADGAVKFENLELGVYYVKETKKPVNVNSADVEFVVSVPMTNPDGNGWLYDITVYPKNATASAGVNLTKVGPKGEAVDGVKFVLQTKDANNAWKYVKKDGATISYDETTPFEYVTSSGAISFDGLKAGEYRFIETYAPSGYIMDGLTKYPFTIGENGEISSTDNEHVTITDDKKTANITVKDEKPEMNKTVKDGSTYGDSTIAGNGSGKDGNVNDNTVEWKVEADVPANVGSLKKYDLVDRMSQGLTWVSPTHADLIITNDKGISLTENTDYTITLPVDGTEGGQWTISYTEAGRKKLQAAGVTKITVTFNTKVNKNAVLGSTGNLNEADLVYSNSINPTDEPDNPNNNKEPKEWKDTDSAIVYTFSIDVTKTSEDGTTPLSGAEFTLYRLLGEVTGEVTEATLKDTTKAEVIATGLTSDANGKINVKPLKDGKYYLVETKAPANYNLLKKPVEVSISVTKTTKVTTSTWTDNEGNIIGAKKTVVTDTFTENSTNGTLSTTVVNKKGFNLPATGGMGSAIFIIGGIALALAGLLIILGSRKKTAVK